MNFFVLIFIILSIFLLLNYLKNLPKNGWQDTQSLNNMQDEARFVIRLVAKVAKSDGRVNAQEAEFIGYILDDISLKIGADNGFRDELKRIYNDEKDSLNSPHEIVFRYLQKFSVNKNRSVQIIAFLLNLAYVDGKFSDTERVTINDIGVGLGLDGSTLDNIFLAFEREFSVKFANSQPKKDPYEVLNLSKSATFDEVKKRYRELVKQNHPDFLMGSGANEQIVQDATKRLQEINEAYKEIRDKFTK